MDPEDARDLTQAFFVRLIEKHGLTTADPSQGRFRSFLLTSMRNFLTSEWRRRTAAKRGGDVEVLSIDYDNAEQRYLVEPAGALSPEAMYERRWAMALLERAVDATYGRNTRIVGLSSCSTPSRSIWAPTLVACRMASCPGNSINARAPFEQRCRG